MEYHYPADGGLEVWYINPDVFQTYTFKDGLVKDYKEGRGFNNRCYYMVMEMESFARKPNTVSIEQTRPRLISVKMIWRDKNGIMLQWSGAINQIPQKITDFFYTREACDYTWKEARYQPGRLKRTSYFRAIPDPGREENKDLPVLEEKQYISQPGYVFESVRFPYKLIPVYEENPSLYEATPPFPRHAVKKPYTPGDRVKASFEGKIYLIETFPIDTSEAQSTSQQR